MKKYDELSLNKKFTLIRLYAKEALKDEDRRVRKEAWRCLGFTKEALKDEDWRVRMEAWRYLGYTKEALKDKDLSIRNEAEIYLSHTIKKKMTVKEICDELGYDVEIVK